MLVGVLATVAYLLFGHFSAPVLQGVSYYLVALPAVAAVLVGTLVNRPGYPLPWHLFALGLLFFAAGDVVWGIYDHFLVQAPLPSPADAFYLATYPCVLAGLVLIAVRRHAPGHAWASLVDAAMIATGVGVLFWVFFVDRYAGNTSLGSLERLVSVAYPLMDVLLLGLLVRLLFGPGKRPPAYYLLNASLACWLLADALFVTPALSGSYEAGGFVGALWLLAYLGFGAAALHPSMRSLSEPAPEGPGTKLAWQRLVLITGISLVVPGTLTVQAVRGQPIDAPVIAAGSVILYLLTAVRVAGLIGERRALEERLRFQAFHDALTNLPNRALFMDRLEHALACVGRKHHQKGCIAVMFVDLDDFKVVNDSLSHAAGDRLLVCVAGRLRACLRNADTVARLGGDEFALLLEDVGGVGDAARVAERCLKEVRTPVELAGRPVRVTASIGIALNESGRDHPDDLLRHADMAMYKAKERGKGNHATFDPRQTSAARSRMSPDDRRPTGR